MQRRYWKWSALAGIGAVCLIFLGGLWLAVSRRWWPVTDHAVLTSQIADVGSQTPLTGAYSRYAWNHPGPLLFWLLALPYRSLPASANGVLVGTLVLNLIAVLGALRVAISRGGLKLLFIAVAAFLLLLRSLGLTFLVDPWNPWVPLLPFAWFLFLAWDVACGRRWSLPLAIGVGSFVLQCHVGFAFPAVAIGTWAVVALLVFSRSVDRAAWWKVGTVTAVVIVAAWVAPVIEQLTRDPGNLRALWDFFPGGGTAQATDFAGNKVVAIGATAGAGLLAREIVGAPWMGGAEPSLFGVIPLSPWWLVVPVAVLVAVGVLGRQRDRRDLVLASATALVALTASWIALANLVGDAFSYVVRFTWAVGLYATVVVVWSTAVLLVPLAREILSQRRIPRFVEPLLAAGVAVLFIVFSMVSLWQARASNQPGEIHGPAVAASVDGVDQWLASRRLRSVVVGSAGLGFGTVDAGVALELRRRGFDALIGGLYARAWTPERRAEGRTAEARVIVACGQPAIEAIRRDTVMVELARYEPTEAERAAEVLPTVVFGSMWTEGPVPPRRAPA